MCVITFLSLCPFTLLRYHLSLVSHRFLFTATADGVDSIRPPPLVYKKWGLQHQDAIVDHVSTGMYTSKQKLIHEALSTEFWRLLEFSCLYFKVYFYSDRIGRYQSKFPLGCHSLYVEISWYIYSNWFVCSSSEVNEEERQAAKCINLVKYFVCRLLGKCKMLHKSVFITGHCISLMYIPELFCGNMSSLSIRKSWSNYATVSERLLKSGVRAEYQHFDRHPLVVMPTKLNHVFSNCSLQA